MTTEHSIAEDLKICDKAMDNLRRMIDGNGLEAAQLRIGASDVKTWALNGKIKIKLIPSLQTEQLSGRNPQGDVMESIDSVKRKAMEPDAQMLSSPAIESAILNTLQKDPGQGWGIKKEKIRLNHANKTFCTIAQCSSCHGQRTIACTTCFGKGETPCTQCLGSGQERKSDGSITNCSQCTGRKIISCRTCNGKSRTPCTLCRESGATTHVCHVHYDAELDFEPELNADAHEVNEILSYFPGRSFSTGHHVDVTHGNMSAQNAHDAYIPLSIRFPVAKTEFQINGKKYPAVIAGIKGRIVKIDPILDNAIKPGISALLKISKSPLASKALIEYACKYKIIRNVLSDLEKNSRKIVYTNLLQDYPSVLSDKYAHATVKYADLALKSLSNRPRTMGLAVGTGFTFLFSSLYFFILRANAVEIFQKHVTLLDIGIACVCLILTWIFIRIKATAALKKILPNEVAPHNTQLSPAGDYLAYAILCVACAWGAAFALSPARQGWIETFRSIF